MGKKEVSHYQKTMVASGETAIFALAGLLWPPLYWGAAITGLVSIIESKRTSTEIKQTFNDLNQQVDLLITKFDNHLHSQHTHNDEPIPPNPQTATPKEIEAYKKSVRRAASTPPPLQEKD